MEKLRIYRTKTQEEHDYLLDSLAEKGYKTLWADFRTFKNKWYMQGDETYLVVDVEYRKIALVTTEKIEDEFSTVPILPVILPPQQPTTDNVEKPSHYFGIYGLEVEAVLRNFIPRYENGYIGHRVGSAIEYLLRAPLKNGIEDIKKAHRNLGMLLEELGEDENQYKRQTGNG